MNEDATGYVYTLSDPRTDEPRYVGATKNPRERLSNHLHDPPNQAVAEWKTELDDAGLEPAMTVISVVPLAELPQREQAVVEQLSSEWDLLNQNGPRYPSQDANTPPEPAPEEPTLSERDVGRLEEMIDVGEDLAEEDEFDRLANLVRETRSEVGI